MKALLVVMAMSGLAYAEDAVELFNEGIKQMKAANYEKACPALKRSNELKPDSGTRGSLAKCYDKQGKTASSWKLWVDLSTTAPAALRADAAANAAKIEPRVPKYILHYPPNSPTNVQVMIDGVIVESTPEAPVPIDPGHYVLEVNAANYSSWKTEFDAKEGVTTEITVELLVKKPVDQPKPTPIEQPDVKPPTKKSKTLGYVSLGLGGAFIVGGAVLGVIAKGRYDDAKDLCGGDIDACDPARVPEAQDKVDSARSAGTLSTVTFITGGVLVGAGIVYIVLVGKKSDQVAVTPAVTNDSVGLAFTRQF